MAGLTKFALTRPVSIIMLVITLIVFGGGSIFTTPLELMPDMEMPILLVMTTYPGAAPQDVEDQVSSVVEDAASTLSGVKNIESTSMENVSVVVLELEYGSNIDEAHTDLRNNIDLYKSELPDDAGDPVIMEMNMDMMPIVTLSATAIGDVDLKYYVEETVQPELEKLGGVASISVSGGTENYIKIALNDEKLKQYGLNMSSLASLIGSADFSLPAGSIGQGNLDMTLRGGVSYETLDSLRHLPLTLANGTIIHLSDVAEVYQAAEELDSLSRYNGLENVSISVSKRQSAATVATCKSVLKVVDEINNSNLGLKLEVINDSSDSIYSSVMSVVQTLILGVILAMLVLFIFMGDWRASLIVGTSIPFSLLLALLAMSAMGFSYNVLSLGGLVIGVGMMVDNSIVVIESCFRLKASHEKFFDAALEGSKTVVNSIVAGTATTVVVFLPIALIKGMSGQLFGQLCFTIVFSLIASLISAVTLVPLTFCVLKPIEKDEAFMTKFMDKVSTAYAHFLPVTFKCKSLVVLIAIALLVGSLMLIPLIGVELMPETDEGIIEISYQVRPGLNLESINAIVEPAETLVASHPDVDHYSIVSGGSGMATLMGNSSDATITVYLKDDRKMETYEIIDEWRDELSNPVDYDINITSSSQMASMGATSSIEVAMRSLQFDKLEEASDIVLDYMDSNPYLVHTSSTITDGNPQAEIIIDPVKASAKGLVPKAVMGTVYSIMEGTEACTITQDGRDFDVRVEYPDDQYESVNDLISLNLTSSTGATVPLLDIAEIKYSNSPLSITRKNGYYTASVTGQKATNAPNKLSQTITDGAKALTLPAGVEITQSSSDERMVEEFSALLGAIATAVFLVFVVMAMQFESARFSIIVMISLPFSLIGAFLALFIFNCSISMTSLMGFLMLVGTVVNNGILLIDSANSMRSGRKLSAEDAVLTAGMLRMRPIFMTTLTTILAMVPMAIGFGDSAATTQGMAFVIIGGLTASTILTLLLLPTFYLLANKHTPEEREKLKAEKLEKRQAKHMEKKRKA